MVAISITLFGSDSLSGANQISLIVAASVSAAISMYVYKMPWSTLERGIADTIGGASTSIIILLFIGMMSASWMVSGVVPTFIYYGVQIMSPRFFLLCACVICAIVSVLTGSSWTTIATIGLAIMGIGKALGISTTWTAGAIISGAYFGDKISPLSDTTVLASSSAKVDLFEHIRYMLRTTIPSFSIALVVFLVAGLLLVPEGEANVGYYTSHLSAVYNINMWVLIVPIITCYLIYRRVPSVITLLLSSFLSGIMAIILQPNIIAQIGEGRADDIIVLLKGIMIVFFTSTNIEMGDEVISSLVATSGMAGMLNTIWLILCAFCFGGIMTASGMLKSITGLVLRMATGRTSLVACTTISGLTLNTVTSDQYMSIVLNASMYLDVYEKMGLERRLLSRTTEDSTTVTSVLIPWNTCGMVQSSVLMVPTIEYLPFCVFNYVSPLVTIIMSRWVKPKKS